MINEILDELKSIRELLERLIGNKIDRNNNNSDTINNSEEQYYIELLATSIEVLVFDKIYDTRIRNGIRVLSDDMDTEIKYLYQLISLNRGNFFRHYKENPYGNGIGKKTFNHLEDVLAKYNLKFNTFIDKDTLIKVKKLIKERENINQ